MGFLDVLSNKMVSASNQISGRAKDTSEQIRLSSENSGLNKQVSVLFQQIGEFYYNQQRGLPMQPGLDIGKMCNEVDTLKIRIHSNEQKIADIKTQISCPSCGRMISNDTKFCPYCGTPIAIQEIQNAQARRDEEIRRAEEALHARQQENEESENVQDSQEGLSCPYCGAKLEPGLKFCTSCGQPVGPLEDYSSIVDDSTDSNNQDTIRSDH